MRARPIYRKQHRDPLVRVVLEMPSDEVEAVDAWGVAQGMASRTATIRALLADMLKINAEGARQDAAEAGRE